MTGHSIHRMAFLQRFSCLGAECEDTCCKGWSMQVDDATCGKYRDFAPELLDAVVDGPGTKIMKRDPVTDYCLQFDDGLCGIHKTRGSDFLGDACNFYPRVTRKVAGAVVMTAALSCPEVVRQALYQDHSFGWQDGMTDRLPFTLKEYAAEGLSAEQARVVHDAFLNAAQSEDAPERILSRIVSVAQSLQAIPQASWPDAVPFFLKTADGRLAEAERKDADPFNLLHALMGIVKAARADHRERLRQTIADMETALQVTLDWDGMGIRATGDSALAYHQLEAIWHANYAPTLNPVLRKWIAAELSIMMFPFSGFGKTLTERAFLLGVRFATLRLAMMSACHAAGGLPPETDQVRVIQSLARVLDHLADPELSLKIYEEPGWLRESRLRGLMGER